MADKAVGEHLASDEQTAQRPEERLQKSEHAAAAAHEAERMLDAPDLGHDLAEEQQQEGEHHREREELQPDDAAEADHPVGCVAQEHHDGHIDQIVGNQDGGQQTFRVLLPAQDAFVGGAAVGIQLVRLLGREGEEGNLAAADKGGKNKQYDCARYGGYAIGVRGGERN